MPPFTTEFTQADVDRLTRSIGLGVRKTEHNGKATEFQSIAAMIELRDRMKSEIAAATAAAAGAARPMPSMCRRTIYNRG